MELDLHKTKYYSIDKQQRLKVQKHIAKCFNPIDQFISFLRYKHELHEL